jgi:RNA polymerase sigma-70 factor (ECF subfamily)
MTVWHSISGFKGESSLSTWVYRITVTKSLDLIRSRQRKKRFAFLTSLTTIRNEIKHHPVTWVHPGIIQENQEKAGYLFRAIDQLPENQKIAFTLSKLEQLSQKEIAEVMQIKEGAVESLIQRAKQNLRKYLEGIYDEIK